jgi:hypothetical protein
MKLICVKSNSHEDWNPLVVDKPISHNAVDVLDKIISHQVVRPTCCRIKGHRNLNITHFVHVLRLPSRARA